MTLGRGANRGSTETVGASVMKYQYSCRGGVGRCFTRDVKCGRQPVHRRACKKELDLSFEDGGGG